MYVNGTIDVFTPLAGAVDCPRSVLMFIRYTDPTTRLTKDHVLRKPITTVGRA